MKKLELTEEHREKLIEMCAHLFGSASWAQNYGKYEEGVLHTSDTDIYVDGVEIHWLEMCMVHLPKALATPNNRDWDISVRQAYHLQEFYHHPKHPVDYLYQEFKDKTVWVKKRKK